MCILRLSVYLDPKSMVWCLDLVPQCQLHGTWTPEELQQFWKEPEKRPFFHIPFGVQVSSSSQLDFRQGFPVLLW